MTPCTPAFSRNSAIDLRLFVFFGFNTGLLFGYSTLLDCSGIHQGCGMTCLIAVTGSKNCGNGKDS